MKSGYRMSSVLTLALCAGVFVLALAVRGWTNTWLTDFWGDSYHHWLITRLTMAHAGVYSDYKGLETVWSPLYHYVSMVPLLLSGNMGIEPLHEMNAVLGAFACALSALLAWRLYAKRTVALAAGGVLALMTWHVAFSGMNVAEVFCGVLLLGLVLFVVWEGQGVEHALRRWQLAPEFLLAAAMMLTRTDLSIYLAVMVVWLWIQKRYADALVIAAGAGVALTGWSAWSYFKTGDVLHWYEQYAANNLHDWMAENGAGAGAWLKWSEYMARLSPWVLPALLGGVAGALTMQGAARRNVWLVTCMLAAHCLFLTVGYARGIVPLLTERYLVLDLPLVAVLVAAWVVVIGEGMRGWQTVRGVRIKMLEGAVAFGLIAITALRFQSDMPELEIRRWGIDPEWQVGHFLELRVPPGERVLTDAPVAIYRSGKPLDDFLSSVELGKPDDTAHALKVNGVQWVVTQPALYDEASAFIPKELLLAQRSGVVDGVEYELVWRYDPNAADIQSEVWFVRSNED